MAAPEVTWSGRGWSRLVSWDDRELPGDSRQHSRTPNPAVTLASSARPILISCLPMICASSLGSFVYLHSVPLLTIRWLGVRSCTRITSRTPLRRSPSWGTALRVMILDHEVVNFLMMRIHAGGSVYRRRGRLLLALISVLVGIWTGCSEQPPYQPGYLVLADPLADSALVAGDTLQEVSRAQVPTPIAERASRIADSLR